MCISYLFFLVYWMIHQRLNVDYGGHVLQSILLLQILVVNNTQIICCLHISTSTTTNREKQPKNSFFVVMVVMVVVVDIIVKKRPSLFLVSALLHTFERKKNDVSNGKKSGDWEIIHSYPWCIIYMRAYGCKNHAHTHKHKYLFWLALLRPFIP